MRPTEKQLIAGLLCALLPLLYSCRSEKTVDDGASFYQDEPFTQEFHEAHAMEGNDVRAVLPDRDGNVWAATAKGVFRKMRGYNNWVPVLDGDENGPSFALAQDSIGTIWLGMWNGLYQYKNGTISKANGPAGPISAICAKAGTVCALGPNGFWTSNSNGFTLQKAAIARSVRDVISDGKDGLWIASDVGLYHWTPTHLEHTYKTDALIAAYTKGLAYNHDGKLWVGGLGGVTIQHNARKEAELRTTDGIPSTYVTAVRLAPDSSMWVGTQNGVVRFWKDGRRSLLFSRRWLVDDQVNDIAFDNEDNAWIATPQGVSAIKKRRMTLASKSTFFYDVLMKRHIRAPWIAGQAHLHVAGDTTTWEPEDDDNDGEYTGNYLAMESFRYAATKDPVAREHAKKAFGFLKMLQEVTGTNGFFARTIIPATWTRMHDGNRTYTERERADELVKEPRFKPVETRWHLSADKKWLWKGDTSSDEMCGHMFGYYYYYTLAADAEEKKVIAAHVGRIVDYLMQHNLNFADVDGTATRWSVWSPDQLNRDPEWLPDRNQNSMEMLAFLKLAHFMTGQAKYQNEYLRLIEEEHYLDNMKEVTKQNPAWFIYFDVVLQAYLYPILIHCENDPERLKFYRNHLEAWFQKRKGDHNPLINFIYNECLGKKAELENSVDFLVDTPLDLVDWPIDHRKREDIQVVRTPVLEDEQVHELQPASIRLTVRWDKNPWTLSGGDPHVEREPVFWLLPYWMGRYLGMISK
ncbi:ligand-binding sensor domain-containing protein [Dyadobacter fermentans]|uniref:Two component regulator propeller domain protein n=1 Tax=Dyadobacter fermentans (strain ATCC 700827 / DSM 18053 / CIP 107007 / KCTC 52180 / NS114) TaxID=471854 RepID=C6W1T9_DYAFD|nr:two-component regulator propeller domain-containing protein [Dyadobacter fermentans]ACT95514.1 two component regulator propeller domain protein [Dyadobacter fermentans DSM 18053]